MASFLFQAKAANGKFVKGEVVAANEAEAKVKIRAQKLVPLKIIPKGTAVGISAASRKKTGGKGVTPKELQVFTRQFAVLISAGVPVVQSLEAMIGPGRTPAMNSALKDILGEVEKGRRLADALTLHPKIFDRMYVNLVRAGEEGGVLDTILNRLATYIEKSVKIRGKVKGAMMYPAVIIVVAIIVIGAILTFVIPNFVQMFQSSGGELPALTQMVIDLSDNFRSNWYLYLAVMIAIPIALKQYYQTEDGRKTLDKVLIDMPIMGALVQKGAIARFSRTLATMLRAGVRIIDSLDIAASTAKNYVIESTILGAKESISSGRTVAEPLRKSKYIPDMVAQMIFIGEQTGNMDQMLEKVADFYEDEVEATADAMTSLIEPLMMVVLGGIIAVLVLAMYLPIFKLAGAAGG
ncbi:MAG: type II secretion system F family protein [Pseudobdellovibrionaceae bacterium]|nr:type II secretion system F family protein [Bdellovibrionales bacterium]USN48883.1 MAG: type II secretion system F family protein [Pseudobdellovibrionaceae bacterium]